MMRLPRFEYFHPQSVAEAAALLAGHGEGATLVAGGTDLFPNMKRRQVSPGVLISLRRVADLRGVRERDDGISIGAATTLHDVATDPLLRTRYPALARAAALISSPQIRNMGTLGGNLCVDTRCAWYDQAECWRSAAGFCLKAGSDTCRLAPGGDRCWAVSSSDLAPIVMALDGRIRLVWNGGERIIPAADLYADDGAHYLAAGGREILAEVLLPRADGVRATYRKLRRRGSIDFPLVGVAAAMTIDVSGNCAGARIVLGGVGSRPARATAAEAAIAGRAPSPENIEAAAEAAAKSVKPMDNADLTPSYRKRMVNVNVRRALAELAATPVATGLAGAAGSAT
jgi:4-hydroxybenzoyl-CoA reductase subunit beta